MANGLQRFGLRTPERQLGTESGRMYREARKLQRSGFEGAANKMADLAAQQRLAEPRGIRSADVAMADAPLLAQAEKVRSAIAAGFKPPDTKQKLFNEMQGAASSGAFGDVTGKSAFSGFQSRATQLGVSPADFERTASKRFGIDLSLFRKPKKDKPNGTTTTPSI